MVANVSEALGIGGTLAGAAIGVIGSVTVSRRERRHAMNDRMRDAFGVFLGAVYPAVGELHELPDAQLSRVDDAYNRLRGERATFIASRRRERAIFGDSLRDRARGVTAALAVLQVLPLPDEVRTAVEECMDYLERLGERRTPELKAVRVKLVAAGAALGSR